MFYKHNCIYILFVDSFVILIKPNVRTHYDYCNMLPHNICMYLIFNDLMCKMLTISSQEMFKLHFSSYIGDDFAFNS